MNVFICFASYSLCILNMLLTIDLLNAIQLKIYSCNRFINIYFKKIVLWSFCVILIQVTKEFLSRAAARKRSCVNHFISQCHTSLLQTKFPHFPLEKFLYLQFLNNAFVFSVLSSMRKETIASHVCKGTETEWYHIWETLDTTRILKSYHHLQFVQSNNGEMRAMQFLS